ncbi:uncharacterized protein LOC104581962 [Brachypodium distachyon]|uniref:uncharacterized protein LOC104581962 n=1 Tax=Brachypodium distachyon TaxID=15368 RepID=UPI00052FF235|nr:uncharacterized protein LOC104581962 [Brachypodium distachyon]|eukprot:XP_010229472.1 uncharacterized protein LOC104581962 [Brachypodium distachyon]
MSGEAEVAAATREVEAFHLRVRQAVSPVLSRPLARRPRRAVQPQCLVKRSKRLAGQGASAGGASRQQRAIIHRLGFAREGERIGDNTLQAYLGLFDKPLAPEHITAILSLVGPWFIAGDFKLIVVPTDKNNDLINRRMMGKFRKLIRDLELKELYLNGRRYTWSNKREVATLEKLDRAFSSEVVKVAWDLGDDPVNPFLRLDSKLRRTAKRLRSWSDRFIGNTKLQILVVTEIILRLDVAMESRTLSPEERGLRRTLKRKLLGLASLERSIASNVRGPFATASIISEAEIWAVVKDQALDKAPGPDGFSGRFFVAYWDTIKHDVVEAFAALALLDVRGMQAVNVAFINLLPKKPDAREVRDFRPVSLIHSVAKLFTKVLAARVAPTLPHLVGLPQCAFVKGRCLHDNFMLVQGTARSLHRARIDVVLLKLDITKAFNTVDWAFFLEVLERRGFGPRFRAWICGLLSTATTRVLLNGILGDSIVHRRGLWQGDPLSPMFFILVMDVLHSMLEKAAEVGLLVLSQPKGSDTDVVGCSWVIADFGAASGLCTNFAKSSAHLIQCLEKQRLLIEGLLQCEVRAFPCVYLGLPLGLRKQTANQLLPLVDKVEGRLP